MSNPPSPTRPGRLVASLRPPQGGQGVRVRELLLDAAQRLESTSESARADAEILLAHCLQKSRTWLFTWPEYSVPTAGEAHFQQLLTQRLRGVPVAHLTGQREFWTLNLKVTPDTLIPRPDTELLVETALSLLPSASAGEPPNILDLGTGTGAIALSLASERPDARLTACDFSATALAVARENARSHGLHHVTLIQSNWFEALPTQRFTMIVTNPPYIETNDPHLAQGDVRFEPLSALTAGNDGLDDIRHIVQHAPAWLIQGGW